MRRAVKAGVRLAMGSDAVYSMFGQNTRELGWFVKAGMTPEQALRTATTTGAEMLGAEDRLGRLAPGYLADIVAVEGNPLEKIDDLVHRRPLGDEGRRGRGTVARAVDKAEEGPEPLLRSARPAPSAAPAA